MRPLVKICGVMNEKDAQVCAKYGTDFIGFVVDYPKPVPWNLDLEQATKIIDTVRDTGTTIVVVGGNREKIMEIARTTKPNYIQLHYRESLEDTRYLVEQLAEINIKVVKTLFPDSTNLIQEAKEFAATGVYALLLDARIPEKATQGGGADLETYNKLQASLDCPIMLAGGITHENVAAMLEATNAPIIDLMTGVENYPGSKNEERVAQLFEALETLK